MTADDSPEDDWTHFGADLKKLRLEHGRPSLRALAKQAHVSRTTLNDAELGRRTTPEVAKRYVVALTALAPDLDPGEIEKWASRCERLRRPTPLPLTRMFHGPARPS